MNLKLLTLLIAILLIPSVFADGGFFPDYHMQLFEPDQKAVIYWDGSKETMVLASAVKAEDIANIAWVVPIQSSQKPEVSEGDILLFQRLAYYFTPRSRYEGKLGSMAAGGVELIETKEVDIYDIAILKATSAKDLIEWLNSNGYVVQAENSEEVLQWYCDKENFYFIANRIDLSNKYQDIIEKIEAGELPATEEELWRGDTWKEVWEDPEKYEPIRLYFEDKRELGIGMATPLKFEFWPEQPYYPLKISSIHSGMTNINVYVISKFPVSDGNGLLAAKETKRVYPNLRKSLKEWVGTERAVLYVTRLSFTDQLERLYSDAVFVKATMKESAWEYFKYWLAELFADKDY